MSDTRKIVVIGLDGAVWSLLKPKMEQGRMPVLKRLVEGGATGNLESIYPPETPAAWPSFMTGKNPGKVGAFDFLVYDPETKTEHPVSARRRKGKTLWRYLSDAGKTSLVLNVPTTYPIEPIQGAMISDFLTPEDARDYAHPVALVEELEQKYGRYPLFFETMSFVAANSEKNCNAFLDELEWMDKTKFEVAETLFDRYDPDFTMIHIWGTDRLQHELWHFFDPEHPRYDATMAAKYGERIEAYYTMLDECMGRLIDKAGEDCISFIISDHGFGPTHYFIDLNSWLLREGFIVLKDSARVKIKKFLWDLGWSPLNVTNWLQPLFKFAALFKTPSPHATIRKATGALAIPGMLDLNRDVDWERTKAYAPFGWSGIYINTKGIRPHGSVDPAEYESIRDDIVRRWDGVINPYTGEKVGGPVHTNETMYHGEFAKYGPDVMPLPLEEKHMPVCFFGFTSKNPVYKNSTLFGNHVMDGILCAHGKGIQPGASQDAILYDLAPTILHLLGLPVPDDMDGRVIDGILTKEERDRGPVQTRLAEEQQAEQSDVLTAEEEAEIRDKLKGLGYL